MYRHGSRFIQFEILGREMKETNTLRLYDYVQAVIGDRWVDWGVSVSFLLLIVSWFVPRDIADFTVNVIGMGILVGVAIRVGYVIACVRLGRKLLRESARSARFREVISNVVAISFFVIAVLLIAWRYLR